jgi:hypothetical protein
MTRIVLPIALLTVFPLTGAHAQQPAAPAPAPAIRTNRTSERPLPLPKEDGMYHFLIFGDRTGGPPEGLKVLAQAVKDTNLLDPDLVMTVGDLVQGYNGQQEWVREAEEYKAIMKDLKMPWFPVAGNHDIYWRGPNKPLREHEGDFEKHFGPLWYWFRHKDCGFVVLFSDEGDAAKGAKDFTASTQNQMSPEQMEWLKSALQEMKSLRHVLVFLHHPRWIEKTYPGTNWPEVHKLLVAAGNVRAVFAGHIHRLHYGGKKDNIDYFALATTGGSIPGHYPEAGYVHHMNLVTVRPEGITVAVLPVGQVIDPRIYSKDREADLDKARNIQPDLADQRIPLGPDGLGASYLEMKITNPAASPVEINLSSDSPASDWFFAPDHFHLALAPGESRTVALTVARLREGFAQGLAAPALQLETDYLGGGIRAPLPPRRVLIPLGMRPPPPDFFTVADNRVLHLNGTSALRVDMGPGDLPDGPFTVEAWVNPIAAGLTAPFVAKTEQSEFALNLAGNVPGFHLFVGGKYFSAIAPTDRAIPAGKWTHVAGVFDGAEMRLFVNGALAAKVPASGPRGRNALPLYIGADPNAKAEPTQFFGGDLDEVRLSSAARYTADFTPAQRHASDPATVYLFRCDRTSGPFLPSDSPGNPYATFAGKPEFLPGRNN